MVRRASFSESQQIKVLPNFHELAVANIAAQDYQQFECRSMMAFGFTLNIC
jgi:hypothetical protein